MNDEQVSAQVERVRVQIDVAMWTAIGLGLAFTAVNVQVFAAAGATAWSPGWVVAWLLDPMVSVLLLGVVRAEQVTARWQITMPWQVVAVKWAAFAATYAMNSWAAWASRSPSAVLLHSVPPVFVLLAAEVAPALRDRLTEAVRVATTAAGTADEEISPAPETTGEQPPHTEPATQPEQEPQEHPTAAPNARVVELAELLAAGCDVTSPQVAALHGVSERTGRRLLAEARTHLEQDPHRPDLHLVKTRTAGGTV